MTGSSSSRSYRLISADGHLMDPPDLWTSQRAREVPRPGAAHGALREGRRLDLPGPRHPEPVQLGRVRGPRARRAGASGVASTTSIPVATTPRRASRPSTSTASTPSCCSPTALDWVVDSTDREFHLTMTRIYNDHLAEFVRVRPRPVRRRRAAARRSASTTRSRRSSASPPCPASWRSSSSAIRTAIPPSVPEDDPVWAAIEETGKPLTIHVSLRSASSFNLAPMALPGTVHFYDAPARMLEFIFSGVLDRFPTLERVPRRDRLRVAAVLTRSSATTTTCRHAKSELRDVKLAAHAERVHEGAVPGVVHHRPVRGREPSRGRRRAHALVERLPAHHVRLAVLVEDDRTPPSWASPTTSVTRSSPGNAQRLFGFGA